LYAGDNRGFVYIIDIYSEDKITVKDLREINKLKNQKEDFKIN